MPYAPFFLLRHPTNGAVEGIRILGKKFAWGFLLALLFICLTARSVFADSVSGQIGYWSFDEGAGTTTTDLSGHENIGTLVNGTGWSSGKFGFGLVFNGVDQYVEIAHTDALNVTKELSVSAWIFNNATANSLLPDPEFHVITSKGWAPDAGGSWTLAWDKKSNDLSFCVRKNSDKGYACVFSSYETLSKDWHHITAVFGGGKLSLYVDGLAVAKPVALRTDYILGNIENIRFGAVLETPNKFLQGWDGNIDEVQIYDRALTDAEIKNLFQETGSKTITDSATSDSGITVAGDQAAKPGKGNQTVETPVITPNGGSFTGSVSVTMTSATPGASVYYTTDGTVPTESSTQYKEPFTLSTDTLVKAKAFKQNSPDSAEASAWFAFTPSSFDFSLSNAGNQTAIKGNSAQNKINASLKSGASKPISLSISGLPSGATSAFSSTSCNPSCSSTLTIYTSNATPTGTFPVIVTGSEGGLSHSTSFDLSIADLPTVTTPTITPTGGSYTGSVSVTMATTTAGASIYYTTDGTTPTQSSTPYAGAMTLSSSATVKAVAFMTGYNPSGVASASFTINQPTVATPTITPNGGNYMGSVSVTMATTTAGASIRYTIDGSSPTTTSTLYSGALNLTNSATVKAAAFMSGYTPSSVASATFTVATTCASGQFLAEYFNNMTLSGAPALTNCTPSINYTWGSGGPGNGVNADQFSARWSGSFNFNAGSYTFTATADDGIRVWVDGTQIINAWKDQAPTTYQATVNLSAGVHAIKVEYYENCCGAVAQVGWQEVVAPPPFDFSLSNAGNKSVTSGSPATNKIDATLVSGSTQSVTFSVSGLPAGATASFSSPSCAPTCSSTLTINTTAGTTPAGTFPITVSAPNGNGTNRTTTFNLTVSVSTIATPTITPNGGSYTGSVTVTMATATSGASIYYTIDGSTPTQSSTLYTGAMTLMSSATVKAAAFMNGYNPSNVASAVFTIATSCASGQFLAEYFNNMTLSGTPALTNCTSSINYNWGSGGPGNGNGLGVGSDLFSARWTGSFNFNAGSYTFTATADDGIRVWVDGNQIISAWKDQSATTYQATINLTAGTHLIKVEYYENGGDAVAQVGWQAAPTPTQLTLNWQDMSTNEEGFAIERKLGSNGSYAQIASVGANMTAYQDTGVNSGSTYCYRVKAFNSTQSSPYSNEACITAP